ncbi:MAG: hypothetical protein WAT47_08960, partial [Nostocoides sp.]
MVIPRRAGADVVPGRAGADVVPGSRVEPLRDPRVARAGRSAWVTGTDAGTLLKPGTVPDPGTLPDPGAMT